MCPEISRQRAHSCNLCMLETQALNVSCFTSSIQDQSISQYLQHQSGLVWYHHSHTEDKELEYWCSRAGVLRAGVVNSLDDSFTQLSLLVHIFRFLILKTVCLMPRAPKSLTAGSTRMLYRQTHLGFQGRLHRIGEQY